jgi:Transposase DDE domain group 1
VWNADARPQTITLNIDATLLTAHSEKEMAAGNYKHGYGFHPLGCWLDETADALAAILRPGNAGSNTAADHFTVLGLALAQLPAEDLHREILVRTDIGGQTHAFASDCREAAIRFSVGYGARKSRYIGTKKATVQASWAAALVNLNPIGQHLLTGAT